MIIAYLLGTGIPILVGSCLLSLAGSSWVGARAHYERLCLAYLIGLVLIAAEMRLMLLADIPVRLWTLLPLQFFPLVIPFGRFLKTGVFIRRVGRADRHLIEPVRGWQLAIVALIVVKLAYVLVMDVTGINRTDDAFTVLLPMAKDVYSGAGMTGYHLDQPVLPGLIISWFGMAAGKWDEYAINLAYFNYYLVLLVLFYANLRGRTGRTGALVAVYVLASFPLLLNHSVMIGYADLPMALFICFAGVYAYRYALDGHLDDLVMAFFFLVAMPGIKIEGKVPHFVIGSVAVCAGVAFRRRLAAPATIWSVSLGLFGATIAVIIALAASYGQQGPAFLPSALWSKIYPGNHLPESLPALWIQFGYHYGNWMIIGTAVAMILPLLAFLLRNQEEMVLGVYSLLHLAAFIYLFCFAEAYVWLLNGATVNRSYLQILPLLLFTATVMIAGLARKTAAVADTSST